MPKDKFFVFRKAMDAKPGVAGFTIIGEAITLNRIVDKNNDSENTIEIGITTLDIELKRINKIPTFIIIDIEEQDINTLIGTKDILRSGDVKLVKFERNQENAIQTILDFFS